MNGATTPLLSGHPTQGMVSYPFSSSYEVYKPLVPNPYFRWSVVAYGGLTTLVGVVYSGTKIYLNDIDYEKLFLSAFITAGGLSIVTYGACCLRRFFSTQTPVLLTMDELRNKVETGTDNDDYLKVGEALAMSAKELGLEFQRVTDYCSDPIGKEPETRSPTANTSITQITDSFKEFRSFVSKALAAVKSKLPQVANENKARATSKNLLLKPSFENIGECLQTLKEGLNQIQEAHQQEIDSLGKKIREVAQGLREESALSTALKNDCPQNTSSLLKTLENILFKIISLKNEPIVAESKLVENLRSENDTLNRELECLKNVLLPRTQALETVYNQIQAYCHTLKQDNKRLANEPGREDARLIPSLIRVLEALGNMLIEAETFPVSLEGRATNAFQSEAVFGNFDPGSPWDQVKTALNGLIQKIKNPYDKDPVCVASPSASFEELSSVRRRDSPTAVTPMSVIY